MADCTCSTQGEGGHKHDCKPDEATVAIEHGDHVDVVCDGHLYHKDKDGKWEECHLEIDDDWPDGCSHDFECAAHHDGSICGTACGHMAVPHGDHVDYLVPVDQDHFELHHPHDDHCDFHGIVKRAKFPPKPKGPAP